MLNNMCALMDGYAMLQPGDIVYCAVSGGADSMALLWGMYLLKEKRGIVLRAVHFNHGLRGEESQRDEDFVRAFCHRFDIPLTVGTETVTPGKKGLEAAAREARYAFFAALPGKIATAHTADDNAETILMHMVRGTGLKGLGGIAPVNGRIIRPMLDVTRRQVLSFLEEYHIDYVTDSSNETDAFLRNRIRHHVMPLLYEENPELAGNLSRMAQSLRWDEQALQSCCEGELPSVSRLRELHPAVRSRMLERYLKECGVREPERAHLAMMEQVVFSQNPSARADFPGGICIGRSYDRLMVCSHRESPPAVRLPDSGTLVCPEWGLTVSVEPAQERQESTPWCFNVVPQGAIWLRSRLPADASRLSGGTKSVKKLLIDRKIPAGQRAFVPVLADDAGILGIGGIGVNLDRAATHGGAVCIRLELL